MPGAGARRITDMSKRKLFFEVDAMLLDRIIAKYPGHSIHTTGIWDRCRMGFVPDGWDGRKVVWGYGRLEDAPETERPFLERDSLEGLPGFGRRIECDICHGAYWYDAPDRTPCPVCSKPVYIEDLIACAALRDV